MKRALACGLLLLFACLIAMPVMAAERPNVILVMADDMGYADLGATGNPKIHTPNLDRFAKESVQVEPFFVCPVCAPTRSSLMTGRYNYRTGVTDTYLGRAMMHGDEVTIAEMLRQAGYSTGIFGKWHLGDCYPMRPMDQGFDESLVHTGGGLCQPAGPPDNSYFDPSLLHNGTRIQTKGYCSDIFTNAVIDFIDGHRDGPFFVYLPFNCPHGPFQVAEEYSDPYDAMNLKPDDFPAVAGGHPLRSIPDNTTKVYGMVTNIDDNLGRLFAKLDSLGLKENTIVIFLTDNGPNGMRFRAGMRACKGSVYEGGIRTCFFIRWPSKLNAGHKVDKMAAHIDVTPTLLDACGVDVPDGVRLDGRSILPLLQNKPVDWPERTLYFQWHRGDAPEPFRACAARAADYKLVNGTELYDMKSDPLETEDVAAEHPDVVAKMRGEYEAWLADVSRDHGYEAPKILIGTPHEETTILTRQDWRGPKATWGRDGLGHWELAVPKGGSFEAEVRFDPAKQPATVYLKVQGIELKKQVAAGVGRVSFDSIDLKASPAERLETWIVAEGAPKSYGAQFVHVSREK
ncbi:MAG TPA: arylsulfatase [Thermoguttaceae bacterium]|nr:arylsulfatase [Thermoguttaceae bacterium]